MKFTPIAKTPLSTAVFYEKKTCCTSKQLSSRQRAEELGAAGFFEKPYDGEELLAAMKNVIG